MRWQDALRERLPKKTVRFMYMTAVGPKNRQLPLWMMAGTNAFNIFLFRNFFNGISMSYIEAARLDGCSELSAFFRIILPLSKPIVAVVAIFSIIGSWGNFLWPYLVLDKGNRTISVLLYELTTGTTVLKNNELMLLLILAAIPPIIVYIIFSRQINGFFF